VKKSRLKHGDKYKYDQVDYINSKIKVKIICPIEQHKEFLETTNDHLVGYG